MRRRGRPPHPDILTPREWEVLALLRQGLSNEDIAQRLDISLAGAKYHVSEILGKLGVATREEAARWQPAERPWWMAALAPVALSRKASLGWLSPVVAAGTAIVVAAGIGLLVWGLMRTGGGSKAIVAPMPTTMPANTIEASACPSETPLPAAGGSAPSFAYAAPDGTIWVTNADGTKAQQLICGATGARNAAWSPSGRFIAHVGEYGGLRLLNVETGQDSVVDDGSQGSLLYGPSAAAFLDWSPVGDTLLYKKFDSSDTRFPLGIWVASPGSAPIAIVQSPAIGRFTWSPGGQRIVYELRSNSAPTTPSAGRTNQLFLVNADGSGAHKLTDGILLSQSWSPEGRLLAYWKDDHGGSATVGDIYVMDVGGEREFSLGEFTSDEHPQWSPDRSRHVFYNLAIDPETGSATPVFDPRGSLIDWSPDGTKVAYVQHAPSPSREHSLVVLDLTSGQRTAYETSTAYLWVHEPGYSGVWSGDGRYYAFVALESPGDADSSALYVADTQSGEANRILDGFELGTVFVSYAPDGTRLLIQQGFRQSPSIWIANADGSGVAKIADGLALLNGGEWLPWRSVTLQ